MVDWEIAVLVIWLLLCIPMYVVRSAVERLHNFKIVRRNKYSCHTILTAHNNQRKAPSDTLMQLETKKEGRMTFHKI